MPSTTTRLIGLLLYAVMTNWCYGAEWHVDNQTGRDSYAGSAEKPFATLQKAINTAKDGDVIQLHPAGAIYRQSALLPARSGITIEGNGVTLDGADPLPNEGWEKVESDLFRKQLPVTAYNRHLLIVDGKMERMNRTQSSNSPPFPPLEELKPGQFRFENIDEKKGWLYVRGSTANLQWATRVNGLATSGICRRIVVRDLKTRNFLNDGFNAHGDGREMRFENIEGYDCFDEGFSAHETCECVIDGGKFFGNENGIADVNQAETVYRNCQFFGNVNTDVYLIGQRHELVDCQITNTTTASALVAGPRADVEGFELKLTRVEVRTKEKSTPALVRVNGGELVIDDCRFTDTTLNTIGAKVIESSAKPAESN
ncbi:hypothetical protein [Bremerella cremea]|uniref:hypothetical protein n=1 Tax=Bremerella cremea TaxID=1031537 RepID=UPI0031EACA25